MTDHDRFLQEQREDEAYAADMYDAGYDDGFSGVNPRALDDDYKRGYDDGLLDQRAPVMQAWWNHNKPWIIPHVKHHTLVADMPESQRRYAQKHQITRCDDLQDIQEEMDYLLAQTAIFSRPWLYEPNHRCIAGFIDLRHRLPGKQDRLVLVRSPIAVHVLDTSPTGVKQYQMSCYVRGIIVETTQPEEAP